MTGMFKSSTRRGAWRVAIILIAAAAGLGACGKRGALEAPTGMEGRFKYPRQYPNRPSVTRLTKPGPESGAKPADAEKPKAENGTPADIKVEKADKAEQDSTGK